MKNPICFRDYLRHLLLPLILLIFMPVKAADYTLSFSDGADDDIEASPVTIKSSMKSFLVSGTSHHYGNIARRLEWSSSNGHSAHYELLAGDAASLAEFDCPFATRTCSPVRVTCEIYDVEIDGHISHFNSRYVWFVNVGYDYDITPTTAWQTHSSSHGEDLGKNYRVPILEGYVYTFKTGCGDGATSNYSTHLIIQNSGCSQLAYDNSGCGSNGATVSYTSSSSGYIYVIVKGTLGGWGEPSAGGSYTLAYRRQSCIPGAVNVLGGGTYCANSRGLSATGGSGGTIYFQGKNSNGVSTEHPGTSATVTSSGTYYFRARSEAGCWGTPGSATITLNPVPGEITVSGGGTVCGRTTLTASGGEPGTIYFQGTQSHGGSTEDPSTSELVNTSGTYYFRARTAAGCWGNQGSATVTVLPQPGAVTVSGGGTYCNNAALTASGGTGGTIYWQARNSNGTLTDKPQTSHTVTSSGTYYFRARNAQGCWGKEGSATVTINKPGDVTVSGGGTYCGTTTLTASGGSGGTIYYQGNVSNGTSTTKPGTTATVSTSGTYYFRARSAGGCWSDQGSATVTIGVPSATTVAGGGTYCGSTALTASGGSGGTIYFQGTTSGGTSTAEPVTSKTVSSSGTYYFRSRNSGGCWGSQGSATVTINSAPAATTVSGGGASCGTITLTASGGSGGTIYYQGTTSEGTNTAEAVTSKTVSASGTYYFRARSSGGCWGPQGTATATINPVPGATAVSGEGSFCGSTTLTASGGSGGTIYYQGTTGNGTSTADPATLKTITASGTYYFRARSAEGCWGQEDNAVVTISSGYTAGVSIQVSPGNIIDQGTEVTFTATNDNGIPSPLYQWKLNGSAIGPNTDELKLSGLHDGDQVSCTMTSDALCVTGLPAASNTITMTVNVANAIEEAGWANSLLIYPNPSGGEFMIVMKAPQSEHITLKLLNMTGQVIYAEDLKTLAGDYSKLLSVDGLVPGVYNLRLQSGTASVCRRILIE